jgi:hypothetical protein
MCVPVKCSVLLVLKKTNINSSISSSFIYQCDSIQKGTVFYDQVIRSFCKWSLPQITVIPELFPFPRLQTEDATAAFLGPRFIVFLFFLFIRCCGSWGFLLVCGCC